MINFGFPDGVSIVDDLEVTDGTGGSPVYTYDWDFDNGDDSQEQNPLYTFNNSGTYNVELAVSDGYTTAYDYVSINVSPPADTTPPTPNPLTWATVPYATGSASISMTATTASDPSGVEYYFDCTNGGGNDSGWQDSASYEDSGLSPGTQYTYRVQARDKSANQNAGGWSTSESATTEAGGGTSYTVFDGGFQDNWAAGGGVSVTSFGGYTCMAVSGGAWSWHNISRASDGADVTGTTYFEYEIYFDSGSSGDQVEWHVTAPDGQEWNNTYQWMSPLAIDGVPDSTPYNMSQNTWHTIRLDCSAQSWWSTASSDMRYIKWQWPEESTAYIRKVRFYSEGGGEDTTPPTPDPSTWATVPYATGSTSVSMTATTASDPSGVQYYFDCTAGGHDSGWQSSATYQDTGLSPSTQYSYRVQTRDQSANQNAGGWSTIQSATTEAAPDTTPPTPNPSTWATVPYATGSTSISMTATTASDPSGVQYFFDCTSGAGGHDSVWQSSATYQDTGLTPSTQYTYQVRTRDQSANQNTGSWSTTQSATTQAGGATTLLTDGFETNFDKWTDGGTTDWDRTTSQKYSGSYSAHAGSADNDLISDNLNTTGYSSITISFRYRDDDIDDSDDIYLQLYNGSSYVNKFELGITSPEDTWHYYETTINNSGGDAAYFISNFRIKFEGTSIDSGENLWIDDVLVTATGGTPPDTTAPTPDPLTWATVPYATGSTSISMTATTASDPSGVEYFFDCTAGGGHDSAWQTSPTYQDTGLTPSTQYSYRVQARDQSTNQNAGDWSTTQSATTQAGGGSNLLTNPGFETGSLSPWAFSGSGGSLVSSGAHSGTYAVEMSGDAVSVHQDIKPYIVAGVQYTFKAYVRVTTETASWGQPRFRAAYWPDLGSADYGEVFAQNSVAAGWQLLQFTHTFTQQEIDDAIYGINVGVINFGFTGGVSLTDDLEVTAP